MSLLSLKVRNLSVLFRGGGVVTMKIILEEQRDTKITQQKTTVFCLWHVKVDPVTWFEICMLLLFPAQFNTRKLVKYFLFLLKLYSHKHYTELGNSQDKTQVMSTLTDSDVIYSYIHVQLTRVMSREDSYLTSLLPAPCNCCDLWLVTFLAAFNTWNKAVSWLHSHNRRVECVLL